MTDSNANIQNKIYYDVGIKYDPERKDTMYHFYSPAKTEINLSSALVDDPLNYDLAISKFKIDTECLPIMIPEMSIPLRENGTAMAVESAYKIWIYYPIPSDTQSVGIDKVMYTTATTENPASSFHPTHTRVFPSNNTQIYELRYGKIGPYNITITPNCGCPTSVDTTNPVRNPGHNYNFKSRKGKVDQQGEQNTYAFNTDPSYFIYDYQSFLDRINIAIEELVYWVYMDHPELQPKNRNFFKIDHRMCIKPVIFRVEDGLIKMYLNQYFLNSRCMLKFSGNLYKYIGMGFKCKFHYSNIEADTTEEEKGSFYIDYNSMAFTGNNDDAIKTYCGQNAILKPVPVGGAVPAPGNRTYEPTILAFNKGFTFFTDDVTTYGSSLTTYGDINAFRYSQFDINGLQLIFIP